MTFIGLVLVAIVIGIQAQGGKGHTGAVWGLLTFFLGLLWWGAVSVIGHLGAAAMIGVGSQDTAISQALIVTMPLLLVMGLIVLTLPSRR